jgi:tRNA A-37 threonylcarbamoyl transferase component Bud32
VRGSEARLRATAWPEMRTFSLAILGAITLIVVHSSCDDHIPVFLGGSFVEASLQVSRFLSAVSLTDDVWSSVGDTLNGGVYATALNATGPKEGKLFFGGRFTATISTLIVNHVGYYDFADASINPLGLGTEDSVWALALYEQYVVVGGTFHTVVDTNQRPYCSVWNTADKKWLAAFDLFLNGPVGALTIHDDYLYVGGLFTASKGTNHTSGLLRYHLPTRTIEGIGEGVDGGVFSFAWDRHNKLVLGGTFCFSSSHKFISMVAVFDGQDFQALGGGISTPSHCNLSVVNALYYDTVNDRMWVGGDYSYAGNTTTNRANNIAYWSYGSEAWNTVASGVDQEVRAILHSGDGTLIIGGDFRKNIAGDFIIGLAGWSETTQTWQPLPSAGVGGCVYALCTSVVVDGNTMYVGGVYDSEGPLVVSHSFTSFYGRDGTLGALEGGVDGPVYVSTTSHDGKDLWIGGAFGRAGSIPASNVAHYDGRQGTWVPMDIGVCQDGFIYALAINPDGIGVTVGGLFYTAGDSVAYNIATYYEIAGWSPVLETTSAGGVVNGVDGTVYVVTYYNSVLVVGGIFNHAGSVASPFLAQHDQGHWHPLWTDYPPLDGVVNVLAVSHQNNLYIAGMFSLGDGCIYWNGTSLMMVSALTSPNDIYPGDPFGVLMVGSFPQIGNAPIVHYHELTGEISSLNFPSTSTTLLTVTVSGTTIFVGGSEVDSTLAFYVGQGYTPNMRSISSGLQWTSLIHSTSFNGGISDLALLSPPQLHSPSAVSSATHDGSRAIFGYSAVAVVSYVAFGMVVLSFPVIVVFCFILLGTVVSFLAVLRWLRKKQEEDRSRSYYERMLEGELDSDFQIQFSDLSVTKRVGAGASGVVYQGTWEGLAVAVKELVISDPSNMEATMREFRSELALMASLRHPNVLLLLGAVISEEKLCLVTPFMEKGSLYDVIHSASYDLVHRMLQAEMMLDAAVGMIYLHERGIIHRDLKSLNLLVDRDWRVHVADFGLSKIQSKGAHLVSASTTGYWAAPETMTASQVTNKSDVFSFGIILWELFGLELYPGLHPLRASYLAAFEGLRPPIPLTCLQPLRVLIQDCWAQNPEERPTFAEITGRLREWKDWDSHDRAESTASGGIGSLTLSGIEAAFDERREVSAPLLAIEQE